MDHHSLGFRDGLPEKRKVRVSAASTRGDNRGNPQPARLKRENEYRGVARRDSDVVRDCSSIGAMVEFFAGYGSMGIWGNTLAASSEPFHLRVSSIDPGRASDRGGLRQGDLIDVRRNSPIERFGLFGQPPAGRRVTLWVQRGSSQTTLEVTPLPLGGSPHFGIRLSRGRL